ncbi:MAG: hypothetical protein H7X93_09275, partial [Sphingomonadaceae bacterium]|nr:hypothetical protein [Sphingomonadaceae bacterium]
MHIVLLALGIAALIAWRKGWLRHADPGDYAALAALLLGFRWLMTGHGLLTIACFAGVAGWSLFRARQMRGAMMTPDEARRLLELPPG